MQNKIMVSFDVDGSILNNKQMQNYARELFEEGIECHIVTRRYANPDDYGDLFCKVYGIKDIHKEHQELFVVAEHCGIKPENIHFMNMADKWEFFDQNKGFLWHLDDDSYEINTINARTQTKGISCFNGANWKPKCQKLIRKEL